MKVSVTLVSLFGIFCVSCLNGFVLDTQQSLRFPKSNSQNEILGLYKRGDHFLSLYYLPPNHDKTEVSEWMSERIERANWIEVREDATLCAIHVLARFLIYDISLPSKEIPGFEIVDVVAVLDTFSSAGVLAMLWTLNGVFVTGLFAPNDDEYKNAYSSRLVATTLLSVPLWITVEWVNHWPISGGIGGIGEIDGFLFLLLGCVGVFGTMVLGRSL